MNSNLSPSFDALAFSACATVPALVARGQIVLERTYYALVKNNAGPIQVEYVGKPLAYWEGAEARRAADQFCDSHAKSSIRDHFVDDAWLIVEGRS